MMKKLLIVPACLISAMLFAQKSNKFDFKVGSEYELPRNATDLALIGNEKDGIVNILLRKEDLTLIKFNSSTLNKATQQTIELDATRNFNSEMFADFSNGNYYWLHSDWDKSNEREVLYYDKVDIAKGKLIDGNTKLLECSKITGSWVSNGLYSRKTTDKYGFHYDADGKKLLVNYRLNPDIKHDKKSYDHISLFVFDENMKKIWGNEFEMPYSEAVMDNVSYSVDGDGNAYLLAKVYESDARIEVDKSSGKPGYHFEIMKFGKDSNKPVIIPIAFDDHFVRQISLTENLQHEMVVVSTYTQNFKGSGTDGIFLATLDKNGKLVTYKKGFYQFPSEELKKFESKKSKRKIDKDENYEVQDMSIHDIVPEKDGGILINCEEYRTIVSHYKDAAGFMHDNTYYLYGDILSSKIDALGNFQWVRKIPKLQKGASPRGTMSYKLINDASGYYFLYLDNLKNLNLDDDETPKAHIDGAGGQLMVSKISMDGKVSKELLFDTRKEDMMIYPSYFYKISGTQFIGRADLKKSRYQPLKITVKEGEVVSSK